MKFKAATGRSAAAGVEFIMVGSRDINASTSICHMSVAFVALIVSSRLAGRDLFEGLASVGENNGSACFRLIASDNDIDVAWIELDAAAHPPGILGGDKSRPGAEEGVENNFATV